MDWDRMLEYRVYHNTVTAWAIAVAVLILSLGVLVLVRRAGVRELEALAKRTDADFTAILCETVGSTRLWFLFILAVRAASLALSLPTRVVRGLYVLVVLAFLFQLAVWGNAALRRWLDRYSARNLATDAAGVTTMRAVVFVGRLVLWTIVLLVGLDNFGIRVSTLVAGLGIGGIAVALAAQNILGDLFSSLSIVVDKPFVVGDFIVIDEFAGTVDRIGLKTTRLRSLSGEQLVFSNSDLLKSRIRNYRLLHERRIVFSFGVEYETPLPALQKIPGMVRETIQGLEKTRFDRAHFKSYGDSALDFEVVYFVLVPEFNTYMDIQQAINFELFRRFAEEGIGFAYPTQKLYLTRQPTTHESEGGDLHGGKLAD
jgi:small-conductance mechanosensitive channel